MNNSMHTPFRIVVLAVIAALTLPVLIRDGMFMDAMLYTSVSKNLSQGIGTFWFPEFSAEGIAGLPTFHEQPPLVFGIQSVFFSLFGESMYTERIYVFFTMLLTILLISKTWKIVSRKNDEKSEWLPLLIWITIPICFWSFSNNMHENTMGLFTLAAVLFYLMSQERNQRMMLLILSGVMIFLATFSKGLPGLFPLAVPVLYWFITKRTAFRKAIMQSVILLGIVCLIYGCLLLYEPARESLRIYFIERALHRMKAVPTVDSHFYIVQRLFIELLPALLITAIVLYIRRREIKLHTEEMKTAVFMLAVGASGTLPLMLTKVQKTFYFSHTLPFFSIGLGLMVAPFVFNKISKISGQNLIRIRNSGYVLTVIVIIVTAAGAGKYSRDKAMLEDIYAIGKVIPKGSVISIPPGLWNEWSMQCYFMRYHTISMTTTQGSNYFLMETGQEERIGKEIFRGKKYVVHTTRHVNP